MKKVLIGLITLFLLFNTTNACMPFTPELITVGKYNGLINKSLPYEMGAKGKFQFIDIENIEKPFSKSYFKSGKYYFIDTLRVDLARFNIGDTIITISDYNNGDYEDYFQVLEIGKISCKNNDEFYIDNKQGYFKSFGKVLWQCGNYRPYNVMSEINLIKKIKDKYKNCNEVVNNNENIEIKIEDIKTDIIKDKGEENEKSWFEILINFIKSVFNKIF